MVYCLVVVSFMCLCKSVRIYGVSCCWLTGRVFRSLGCWVCVIRLVRNLNYLEKTKLNSASAVTVGWWLLLLKYSFASLEQKDGSVVCTWVSPYGFAGVVCAGGWAAGARDRDTKLQVKGFPLYWNRGEVAAGLLRRWWKSVLLLFSSVCFLSLWPMFLCIDSPGGCGLLSRWQDKSLVCSVCMLMDRCEELLNSRMPEGQDADKVYSIRSLFLGAEGREECRKGLPRARQWVLVGADRKLGCLLLYILIGLGKREKSPMLSFD